MLAYTEERADSAEGEMGRLIRGEGQLSKKGRAVTKVVEGHAHNEMKQDKRKLCRLGKR